MHEKYVDAILAANEDEAHATVIAELRESIKRAEDTLQRLLLDKSDEVGQIMREWANHVKASEAELAKVNQWTREYVDEQTKPLIDSAFEYLMEEGRIPYLLKAYVVGLINGNMHRTVFRTFAIDYYLMTKVDERHGDRKAVDNLLKEI